MITSSIIHKKYLTKEKVGTQFEQKTEHCDLVKLRDEHTICFSFENH